MSGRRTESGILGEEADGLEVKLDRLPRHDLSSSNQLSSS